MDEAGNGGVDVRWFTVGDGAARGIVEVAIRSALVAQRARLARVAVDIVSDRDWPTSVHAAVRLAEERLTRNRQRDISLTLDPRLDEDFDILHALAPFSIGSTGTSSRGEHIWDANDTGTSVAFALTHRGTRREVCHHRSRRRRE